MNIALHARTVSAWFSDQILQRLLKDAGWLMGGNALAALIGLATMAITARTLGPAGLGATVLIMTYAQLMNRLLSFESWHAIVKFGAHALERKDKDELARLVKLGTLLDMAGALLGFIAAVALAPFIAEWIGLENDYRWLLSLYPAVILFNIPGAPTGVLRLLNKFHLVSLHRIAVSVIIFAGVAIAASSKAGVAGMLLAYAAGQVVGQILLLGAGWWVLAREDMTPARIWKASIQKTHIRLREILQFVFFTNIESSVKILRDMDVFIIGNLLNTEAVGLYRVSRRLADVANMFIDPFFYAAFPSFNKLYASGNWTEFRRLAVRSSLIVGGVVSLGWLGFVVIGHWFIGLVFGDAYAAAYPVAVVCMLGMVIWAFAQPLSPALYSTNGYRKAFFIHLATSIAYAAMLIVAIHLAGMQGAAWAYAIFYLAWSAMMLAILVRQLHKHE